MTQKLGHSCGRWYNGLTDTYAARRSTRQVLSVENLEFSLQNFSIYCIISHNFLKKQMLIYNMWIVPPSIYPPLLVVKLFLQTKRISGQSTMFPYQMTSI